MLTQLLETLTLPPQAARGSQLVVRNCVDVGMDVEGWYALGHHAPKAFLTAVAKQESSEQLGQNPVEQLWAVFTDNNFELFDQAVPGASPITVVRLF